MKFISFLPLSLILLTAGCTGSGSGIDIGKASSNPLHRHWVLVDMNRAGATVTLPEPSRIDITFAPGRMSGNGGCNSFQGSYKSGKDGELKLLETGWTEMACDLLNLEVAFQEVLSKVNQYAIQNEQLVLSDGSTLNTLTFAPFQPPAPLPLAGTTWTLQTIEETNGKGPEAGVSAMPANAGRSTLRIMGAAVSGSGGCNGYSAEAQIGQGETIAFRMGPSSTMACAGAVMNQEIRFFNDLPKMTRYAINGSHLVLSNQQRSLSLHFQGKQIP